MARAAAASKGFGASLAGMGGRLSAAGTRMMTAGRTATTYLTLPLVAGGVAATKMALDFDQAFTRIAALTNVSGDAIGRWREQVMTLSGETARAPQELAEALYFLASAGLDANQIMPALEASAQGAAVGMGTAATNGRLVANVLNAFPESGQRAIDVLDTLAAGIREGSAEPDEFASAIGRLLPVAAQAGVGFDGLVASLAALSNIGLPVTEGVTAIRGALQALAAPGAQAVETMDEFGLTAQGILDAIDERGLVGAFRMVDEAVQRGTNTQADYIGALRRIIPNVRAFTGILGLTGQEAEEVDGIFRRVTDSTGDLGGAMNRTARSDAFKMQHSLNQLKIAAIELGQKLIPIGQDIVDWAADLATGFTELSPGMQDFIIKAAGAAAVLGPFMLILGGAARLAGGVVSLAGGIAKLGGAISIAGGAASAGAGLLAFLRGLGRIGGIAAAALSWAGLIQQFATGFRPPESETGQWMADLTTNADSAGTAIENLMSQWRLGFTTQFPGMTEAERTLLGFEHMIEEMGGNIPRFREVEAAMFANARVANDWTGMQTALNLALLRSSTELSGAERRLYDVALGAGDVESAWRLLNGTVTHGTGVISNHKAQLIASAIETGNLDTAHRLLVNTLERTPPRVGLDDRAFVGEMALVNQELGNVAGRHVEPSAGLNDQAFRGEVAYVHGALNNVDRSRADPTVDADTHGFTGEMAYVRQTLSSVNAQTARPSVDLDTGGFVGEVAYVRGLLAGIPDETVYINTVATGGYGGGGGGGSATSGQQAPHAGGVVGASGARRLHAGGAGMRGDEYGVVLQRGERVLSRGDLIQLRNMLGVGGVMSARGARHDVPRGGDGGLVGLRISGRLETQFGPEDLVAVVEEVVDGEGAYQRRLARMGR